MKGRGKRPRLTILLLLGLMIFFLRCGQGTSGGDNAYEFSAIYPDYLYQISLGDPWGTGTLNEIDDTDSWEFKFSNSPDQYGFYSVTDGDSFFMLMEEDQIIIWESGWTPLMGVKRLKGPTGLEVGGTYNWVTNEFFYPYNKLIVYPTDDPPDGTGEMEMWVDDYDVLFDVLSYEFNDTYKGMEAYPEGSPLHALKDKTGKADAIPPMMAFPLGGDVILMGTDYDEIEFFATREQPPGYSLLEDAGKYACLAGWEDQPRVILTIEECSGDPGYPCAIFDTPDDGGSGEVGITDNGDGSFWIDGFMYGIIAPGKLIVLYDEGGDISGCIPSWAIPDFPQEDSGAE